MADRFFDLLSKLARVPKEEIDAEQARMDRNKAARTKRKQAKPGQIVGDRFAKRTRRKAG